MIIMQNKKSFKYLDWQTIGIYAFMQYEWIPQCYLKHFYRCDTLSMQRIPFQAFGATDATERWQIDSL